MSPPHSVPFDTVFRQHAPFVWRVLQRHGVAERHLEDACQEVFLVVHRRLSEFEGRSSLRTWLYGIAVRVAAATRRRAAARREILPEALPETAHDPDLLGHAARQQELALVEQALLRIAEKEREVFVLYELEGLTMREVAQALGVPENTALSRLYVARKEIRRWVLRHQRRTHDPKSSTPPAEVPARATHAGGHAR